MKDEHIEDDNEREVEIEFNISDVDASKSSSNDKKAFDTKFVENHEDIESFSTSGNEILESDGTSDSAPESATQESNISTEDDSYNNSDSEEVSIPSESGDSSGEKEEDNDKNDEEEKKDNESGSESDKTESSSEDKMPDHKENDPDADKLTDRNNNNNNNNNNNINNHNNPEGNNNQNGDNNAGNGPRQPHANNPLNQNNKNNQNKNGNQNEQSKSSNTNNQSSRQNKPNNDDVGSRNLKNSLANKARSLFKNNKRKKSDSSNGSEDSSNDDSSSNSDDKSNGVEELAKQKFKKFIRKIIIYGLLIFLVGLFILVFFVSFLSYLGFDVSITGLVGIKTYDTDYYQPTYEPGTKENKDEIKYYKKLDEIAKNYGSEHGVELKNGYIHAALMYYYYQIDVMWEMEENNTSVDYNKMIDMADKLSKAIAEEFGDEEIDYAIDGRLYNLFKNNEDLKKYYEKTLKNMDMDNLLNDVFKQAEGLENIEFTDEEVLTSETKVTVVETKKETSTKTETKKTTTLTVNQYIADSIYANSTTLNSESVKAYTIAYSTKLASQNNKLSIDSSNVSASNSLCSVSLGCSYDVDGNLVSGGNDQSTKNTYFYKGQYYYKKPLNSEEITTLNKDINSVFGNVLVNSDGTYPDLDVEKINGLGDSYKTILTNSYGNLSYKNIGEDSYILDGSYGTKQVKSSVIFYDQNDFASYNFCGKKNETIKSSGCGTTSMAIIVSTYEKNSKYDPVFMTGEARKTGYCGGGITGTSPGFFKKEANTMKYKYYKASKYSKKDLNLVLQHLSQGHLVIAHMSAGHFTSGGHYMVLGGVDPDTKKVYVYDPYSKVNKSYRGTGTGWYSFNDIIVKEAWNFYIIWKG